MNLRTKLLLTTATTALLVLGISEWLSYQETMQFFGNHLAEMGRDGSTPADAGSLEAGMEGLAGRLIRIHFAHAVAEVLALVAVLALFWSRLVLTPIRDILGQMNSLSHSVTCRELPVRREDEIGQMANELNRLGGRLTTAMEHAATASELSALALMGQSLLRKVATARDQLAAALRALAEARKSGSTPPDSAVISLETVLERLSALPDMFEKEFENRLRERSRNPSLEPRPADALASQFRATVVRL